MFKSALTPCVIEFTVKRTGGSFKTGHVGAIPTSATTTTAASEAAMSGAVPGSGAAAATTVTGVGEEAAASERDQSQVDAGGEGGVSGVGQVASSWLGQIKPKESSYKVTHAGAAKQYGGYLFCFLVATFV